LTPAREVTPPSGDKLRAIDRRLRFKVELHVEPLVTITDFRDQPGRRLAATLREWAALLNQAAASLE
jgi:hypothetical protein